MHYSILINNYNNAKWLPQALDTALEQSRPAFDILVADAGSTDGSVDIIKAYSAKNPVIRFLLFPRLGQISVVGRAIKQVKGDIIFLLDGDDYYDRHHIAAVSKLWKKHDKLECVYTNFHMVGPQTIIEQRRQLFGKNKTHLFGSLPVDESYYWGCTAQLRRVLPKFYQASITSCLSLKKEHACTLPFDKWDSSGPDDKINYVDYFISLASALYAGARCYSPSKTVYHRVHEQSLLAKSAADASPDQPRRSSERQISEWLLALPSNSQTTRHALWAELIDAAEPNEVHLDAYVRAMKKIGRSGSETRRDMLHKQPSLNHLDRIITIFRKYLFTKGINTYHSRIN